MARASIRCHYHLAQIDHCSFLDFAVTIVGVALAATYIVAIVTFTCLFITKLLFEIEEIVFSFHHCCSMFVCHQHYTVVPSCNMMVR